MNDCALSLFFFKDIDLRNVTDALMPTEVQCDVCCLVYDVTNPRSFEFVARIYLVLLKLLFHSNFINHIRRADLLSEILRELQDTGTYCWKQIGNSFSKARLHSPTGIFLLQTQGT